MVAGFLMGGYGPGSDYYPVMMQFIFIFPIIFFSIKANPKASLIGWFLFNGFYELMKTIVGIYDEAYRLSIYRYTFLIALGCFMYLYHGKIRKALWGCCLVGIVYIVITQYLGYETVIINNDWKGTSFLAALYIAPIFYVIIKRFGHAHNGFFALLGRASFNIFLTQMVYYFFAAGFVYSVVDSLVLRIIINIIICCTAGIIFYLIESRFTQWLIKKLSPFLVRVGDRIKAR